MTFQPGTPKHPLSGARKGYKKRKAAEARALLAVLDKTGFSPWERLYELVRDKELRPSDEAKVCMHMTEYIDQKAKPTDVPQVNVNIANVTQTTPSSVAREAMRSILEDPAKAEAVKLLLSPPASTMPSVSTMPETLLAGTVPD